MEVRWPPASVGAFNPQITHLSPTSCTLLHDLDTSPISSSSSSSSYVPPFSQQTLLPFLSRSGAPPVIPKVFPVVAFLNGRTLLMTPFTFEERKWARGGKQVVEASREQLPLMLAWALSIHKVRVDLKIERMKS
jgi:hypothetical protein